MAWSERFKQRLEAGGAPMFALDFQAPDLLSDTLTEERFVLHSHDAPASDRHIAHAIESVDGSGQRISLRRWESSIGGLRVNLAGSNVAQLVAKRIQRGMMAELKVGFEGFRYEEFQTCGLYVYRGLSGSRNNWSIEFDDLFTAFQGPASVASSESFYEDAGTRTTLIQFWDTTDASLLANTSGFEKDATSGAKGLMLCQPSGGDEFYLKWTSKTSLSFDVVNSNALNTILSDMSGPPSVSPGDAITSIGYVNDPVPDVAHKILFGSAVGSSTVVMPSNWHMGLNVNSHNFNRDDFERWKNRFTGTYANFLADFIVPSPLENPFRGLEEFMASFGAWLVIKEGGLSWRFVQQIVGGSDFSAKYCAENLITDDDIVSEDGYQVYHQDAPVEYFQVRFNAGAAGAGRAGINEPVRTMPASFALDHASRAFSFGSSSNLDLALSNMRHRLAPWYHRIPDEMRLTLKGWKFAELVPGDVVTLQSDYIYNMVNGSQLERVESSTTGFGFVGKVKRTHQDTQYMVTGVDVDWSGFTTSVQLSTLPNTE